MFDDIAGASPKARLASYMPVALPTAATATLAKTTLQSLTQWRRKEVTKFATRPAQAKLHVAMKQVARVVEPPRMCNMFGARHGAARRPYRRPPPELRDRPVLRHPAAEGP